MDPILPIIPHQGIAPIGASFAVERAGERRRDGEGRERRREQPAPDEGDDDEREDDDRPHIDVTA